MGSSPPPRCRSHPPPKTSSIQGAKPGTSQVEGKDRLWVWYCMVIYIYICMYIYMYIYIYVYVFWKTKHVYNKNHWFWFKITVPIFLGLLTIMLMVNMIRISCKVQPLTQHRKSRMPLMKAWWNVLDLWGEHVRTPCSTKGTINYMCIIYIYNNIYIYMYAYIYIHTW